MNNKPSVKAQVTSTTSILIKAVSGDVDLDLDNQVYAINWFNTRFKWLYTFYNMAAARSVFKIGGKVFFKAEVSLTVQGKDEDARKLLLIVNYPSAYSFLELVKDRYFQLVSIFRIVAVKGFTFGFSERLDSKELLQDRRSSIDATKVYGMHHFRTNKAVIDFLPQVRDMAAAGGVTLYFAGQISSLLFSANKNGEETQVPCLIDGLLLYEGDSKEQLKSLFKTEDYQDEIKKLDSSYLALLKRVM
jgi:uncharacterized protein (DUF1330 family)